MNFTFFILSQLIKFSAIDNQTSRCQKASNDKVVLNTQRRLVNDAKIRKKLPKQILLTLLRTNIILILITQPLTCPIAKASVPIRHYPILPARAGCLRLCIAQNVVQGHGNKLSSPADAGPPPWLLHRTTVAIIIAISLNLALQADVRTTNIYIRKHRA